MVIFFTFNQLTEVIILAHYDNTYTRNQNSGALKNLREFHEKAYLLQKVMREVKIQWK